MKKSLLNFIVFIEQILMKQVLSKAKNIIASNQVLEVDN
jgi:hypothetical protein